MRKRGKERRHQRLARGAPLQRQRAHQAGAQPAAEHLLCGEEGRGRVREPGVGCAP